MRKEASYSGFGLWGASLAVAVALAALLLATGARANGAFALFLLFTAVLAYLCLRWVATGHIKKQEWLASRASVPALFFISGFAALIYQVVWQRVLFTTFGVNIESVTVIVSVFMFGLGIGALIGGQVQKRFPGRLLECFMAIEAAIAVFGMFSIPLIEAAGRLAPHDSLPALIGTTYALLAVPTMLMGSTLPILVGYLQRRHSNLGGTVSTLYAFNTLGSGVASLLTVMLLFTVTGQQGTLLFAALCNIVTALLVWRVCRALAEKPAAAVAEAAPPEGHGLSYGKALILAGLAGYVSLSLEILWFRILGFMTATKPQVFGTMLAIFLIGIAAGSLKAKRWSEEGRAPRDFLTRSLMWVAVIAYLSAPLVGFVSSALGKEMGVFIGYGAVGFIAYFSGGIFPMLCQMGIASARSAHTGVAVSWMYFFNIIGATLGSLVTGFVLFDWFGLPCNVLIICAATLAALVLLWHATGWKRQVALAAGACVALALWVHLPLYGDIISRLHGLPQGQAFKYVEENRHGIITVLADEGGDMIFGNGAYDGKFNIDPVSNGNAITRVYMLSALHPKPRRVLEVGMSGAAATKALTMYEPVEELVTVEINPGYQDVIAHYPEIASALAHPKTRIEIDDARRWLARHPGETFDVITMNTLYYWRSNATNILSREFLELCKRHLNPGGIVYYNTTGARDSVHTVAHVFKYVTMYDNFVAGSDRPFTLTYGQRKKNLLSFIGDDGKPVFLSSPAHREVMQKLATHEIKDMREEALAEKHLWLITDDNMAGEYKIRQAFLPAWWYGE